MGSSRTLLDLKDDPRTKKIVALAFAWKMSMALVLTLKTIGLGLDAMASTPVRV